MDVSRLQFVLVNVDDGFCINEVDFFQIERL